MKWLKISKIIDERDINMDNAVETLKDMLEMLMHIDRTVRQLGKNLKEKIDGIEYEQFSHEIYKMKNFTEAKEFNRNFKCAEAKKCRECHRSKMNSSNPCSYIRALMKSLLVDAME